MAHVGSDTSSLAVTCSRSPTTGKRRYGQCRICFSSDHICKLLSPCFCKGSLMYVHKDCLEHWLQSTSSDTCELCHFQFLTEKKPMNFREWLQRGRGIDRRRLVADFCCGMTLTPMTLTSVGLLVNSSYHFDYPYQRSRPNVYYVLLALACIIMILYVYWIANTVRTHYNVYRAWRLTHFHIHLILASDQFAKEDDGEEDQTALSRASAEVQPTYVDPRLRLNIEYSFFDDDGSRNSQRPSLSRATVHHEDEVSRSSKTAAKARVSRKFMNELEELEREKQDPLTELEKVLQHVEGHGHEPCNRCTHHHVKHKHDDIRDYDIWDDLCDDPLENQGVVATVPTQEGQPIEWQKVIHCPAQTRPRRADSLESIPSMATFEENVSPDPPVRLQERVYYPSLQRRARRSDEEGSTRASTFSSSPKTPYSSASDGTSQKSLDVADRGSKSVSFRDCVDDDPPGSDPQQEWGPENEHDPPASKTNAPAEAKEAHHDPHPDNEAL